jgi:molybdate transport system permease protein
MNEGRSPWRVAGRAMLRALAPDRITFTLVALLLLIFLVLPVAAILIKVARATAPLDALGSPVVTEALRLSLVTSSISAVVAAVLGTPVAFLLARYRFPGRAVVDSLVDLPMVLPPAVAGLGLLMAFGRRGVLGGALDVLGLELAFTTAAVVMAQTFVAAPFYIRSAKAGFEGVDRELERVSATLGSSRLRTFFRVTVPLAGPALMGGAVMAWARALGEFGATIMFAGNTIGRTQTMPLAIYIAFQDDLTASLVLAGILVVVSFAVLFTFKALLGRSPLGAARA